MKIQLKYKTEAIYVEVYETNWEEESNRAHSLSAKKPGVLESKTAITYKDDGSHEQELNALLKVLRAEHTEIIQQHYKDVARGHASEFRGSGKRDE